MLINQTTTAHQYTNLWINRSINELINQSPSQSITKSICQSLSLTNQSDNKLSISQSTTTNQSVNRSLLTKKIIYQLINQSLPDKYINRNKWIGVSCTSHSNGWIHMFGRQVKERIADVLKFPIAESIPVRTGHAQMDHRHAMRPSRNLSAAII